MREHDLQNLIRIELSKYGIPFRTNAGKFWQGRLTTLNGHKVLMDPRPVMGLPNGFTDLLFVGDDGTVAFIEIKTESGRVRPDQQKFIDMMISKGYRAGVARSVEDALKIIGGK